MRNPAAKGPARTTGEGERDVGTRVAVDDCGGGVTPRSLALCSATRSGCRGHDGTTGRRQDRGRAAADAARRPRLRGGHRSGGRRPLPTGPSRPHRRRPHPIHRPGLHGRTRRPINWRIRIRATVHAISWSETAIVLGLAVAPAPLVVLTTGTGVAIALLSMKPSPLKTAFGIAKSMLLAAGGGVALHTLGWSPQDTDLRHVIGMIGLAYIVAVVLDELLTLPVIAMATGTRSQALLGRPRARLTSALARFVLIAVTLIILQADPRLLLAVPPLVLSLHLLYSNQVKCPDRAAGLAAPRPHHRRAQRGRPGQGPHHRRHPGRRTLLRRRGRDRAARRRPHRPRRQRRHHLRRPGRRARPRWTAPSSPLALEGHDRTVDVGDAAAAVPRPGAALRAGAVHAAHLRLRAVHRRPQRPGVRRAGPGRRRARVRRHPRRADRAGQPPAPARPRAPSSSTPGTPTG